MFHAKSAKETPAKNAEHNFYGFCGLCWPLHESPTLKDRNSLVALHQLALWH